MPRFLCVSKCRRYWGLPILLKKYHCKSILHQLKVLRSNFLKLKPQLWKRIREFWVFGPTECFSSQSQALHQLRFLLRLHHRESTIVGGGTAYSGTNKVYIIDTGIDTDHPDLNVDAGSGKTFVPRTTTADDDNGHGTHCAGIVAAINNDRGVVGVAAGAKVVPVKVLDKRGSGLMSTIIAGVDFVTANGIAGDAVNMSLGGGAYTPLDTKVIGMGAKGLFVALAAGNESDDAENHSPARADGTNIYTVSACDKDRVWAYFSNYGDHVDYCAPGVSVLSTYKGGALATMSGTSMAAPHVCGILLATGGKPKSDGNVTGDPDGDPDPIVHK